MGARVLFVPETFNLGETSRGVEIAKALRGGGHDILFAGYSTHLAGYIRDAEFEFELMEPHMSDADAAELIAFDQYRSLRVPFTEDMLGTRVASEIELFERWRPDVVVIGATFSTFISARAAGVPLVFVKPYSASYGRMTTLREVRLTGGTGALPRAVNRLAGAAARGLAGHLRYLPSSFRTVASRYGLTLPGRSVEFLNADVDLLASLFPAIDPPDLAPHEAVVGPVYATSDAELPDRVLELAGVARPLVYVGMGSSASHDLALDVLRQVGTMDVDVISSTGRYIPPIERDILPDNVHVFDFLPAPKLAGLIDVSITHGGEGTIQTACLSGAPLAGIGLQAEQRSNIQECVAYGNGLRFTPGDLRRGRLPAMVDRLLSEPSFKRAATRLREAAADLDGPGECARHILRIAERARATGGA
ncbi:MAG: glycosyltransferase [Actinomycetaceae bacterium]|nr:glycosyltransferase [Actinomycetaceae bacterium]